MIEDIQVFSVFEVTCHLKQVIETQIESLYVSGELSNFVHHSSGHMYFNLKDENATLRCTFFKGQNFGLDFRPADGIQVICYGKLTLYERGGTYNLNVRNMSLAGKGFLAQQFEFLKEKLKSEGLFESVHKKTLPPFPRKIGIITSPTGAALQDILNILSRRYPAEVVVYPSLMQGKEAPQQVIAGLEHFNQNPDVDLIVITRGGGSQKDLFCFNDESLARAIFASQLPVVSAVGHEIDFTICDFVADRRAPTPSAAAELIVPDRKDLLAHLKSLSSRASLILESTLARTSESLNKAGFQLQRYHPEQMLGNYQMRLDFVHQALLNSSILLKDKRSELDQISQEFRIISQSKLTYKQNTSQNQLQQVSNLLQSTIKELVTQAKTTYTTHRLTFEQNSPYLIFKKGYALVQKEGRLVRSVKNLQIKDTVDIRFQDGVVSSEIKDTKG
ncbi:MAG: exodeoxyribonuclease VII large subunit [Candidatus Cloacimonetes bacterium]|nr:exodeoxyribonuclease VII large subunit [Candidatus Cloacimonadota bacterium]